MKYDVIVVGAGIAGLTAAIYVARASKSVLVLEGTVQGGQIINTINIENWPGDYKVSGAELMQKIYKQALELGAEVEFENVEKIEQEKAGFKVTTEDDEYLADTIILAVGAEPRKLSEMQVRSAGDKPISYCATCDGALYKNKPVVVVGSGETAKHEIAYLKNIASKVYQIHHDDPIPEDAAVVFAAIGRVPSTKKFANLVKLDNDGYIVAGEDCATSCPGVYAAGDCRTKNVRQLITAAGDGAVAAGAAVKYLG